MSRLRRIFSKFASGQSVKQTTSATLDEGGLPFEDQVSIARWAMETFGQPASDARVLTRAIEEMTELLRALAADDGNPKANEEAADVMIVLYRLAHRMGFILRHAAETAPWVPMDGETYLSIAASANVFLAQALDRMTHGKHPEYTIELIAMAARTLEMMVADRGGSLDDAVNAKMTINRKREWKQDGTGHGYHVRAGSEAAARESGDATAS
jgi:NTP pyrophosphatase (non-canonical NTP hydrolase)